MTKKEWREKWSEYVRGSFPEPVPDDEKILAASIDSVDAFDFFYSLHLQELEKIREMIRGMKKVCLHRGECWEFDCEILSKNEALDDILLVITDEK